MMIGMRLSCLVLMIGFFAGHSYGEVASNEKKSQEAEALTRKFNTSAFLKSVAKTCSKAGDVAAAKSKEEKQQAACQLVGSVCETAAVLSEKTKTRSLSYTYLQALSVLSTDKEKEEYIARILGQKEEALFFLDELFALAKVLLVEEIPVFIEEIHQNTIKNLKFNEK